MIIDPIKLALSISASAVILVGGLVFLSAKTPSLSVVKPTVVLTSSEPLDVAISNNSQIGGLESDENLDEYSQIDPKDAKIEAEVMTASIQTSNPSNYSDWSLENLSDHALEITQ